MRQGGNEVVAEENSATMTSDQSWSKLLAVNALYIGFGISGGVVQGSMPPILREAGYSVASLGWLFLLYLPFGMNFLWASYVDRFSLPFLGRRTGWIVTTQLVTAVLIAGIAFGSDLPAGVLFGLALTAVFCLATMDIALDALVVEQVPVGWRPKAAATKLAALGAGGILGGGLFVPLFSWLGWQGGFLVFAVAMVVVSMPVLTLVKADSLQPPRRRDIGNIEEGRAGPSLLGLFRHRRLRNRLLILTAACCIIFPLSGLNRIMLVDIGMPAERIGWIVGTLGPLAMMATAGISMPLMQTLGLLRTLYIFAAVLMVSTLALLAGFNAANASIAIAGTTAMTGAVSGMFVAMLARIIDWADRGQPATDYAAYYGISRFASTTATILAAPLISWVGWSAFYLAGIFAVPLVVWSLRRILVEAET